MKVSGICKKHGETEYIVTTYLSAERGERTHCVCYLCKKESKHKSYLTNKETISAKHKEYREKNKDKKAKQDREYYLKNKDRINRYSSLYQKSKGYKFSKKWKKENPDKVVEYRTKRKAKQYGAKINDFTKKQWSYVLEALGNECFYCGRDDVKLTQDHIIPLFRGGNHTLMNIVPACLSCNCSKGTKFINEWRNYGDN